METQKLNGKSEGVAPGSLERMVRHQKSMRQITITEERYNDLKRSESALEWLQNRGVCWRGADDLISGWVIGDETEWHYKIAGDVRDLVEKHRAALMPNG